MNRRIHYSIKNEKPEIGLNPVSSLFIPLYSGIGSILLFHRALSEDDDFLCEELEVKASCLEEAIMYYRHKNYDFVTLDEAHERIIYTQLNQRKFLVFTFDDGYIDTLSIVYPILKKYEVPFTLYVRSSFPDRTADVRWYALKDLINQSKRINFIFEGYIYDFFTEKQSEKVFTYQVIKDTIINMDSDHIPLFLEALFKGSGIAVSDYVDKPTLNWSQIKQLS
ncbi:MAG: polysaccharide deacetylase family protein [Alkalibacterium sp.]|nr:polysaccharide deacetylase family protein [Alkalibacterium sp.]